MANKHAIQRVAEALEQMGIGYEVGDKPPSRIEDSATLANLAKCSVKTARNSLTYLRWAGGDVQKAIEDIREYVNERNRNHGLPLHSVKPAKDE